MKVDQHHVGTSNHALRGDMEHLRYAIGAGIAAAYRVRRIDADRHPRETLDHRYLCKIDKVAVRISQVGLHATQAKDYLAVSFRGQVLCCIQGFFQGNSEASFEQDGKFLLPTYRLQQFEILRVAGANLQHDTGRIARLPQRLTDLIHVLLVQDLHGDHLDAIFSCQLKNIRQTVLAMPLKSVRTGARLVGPHARADLAIFLQGAQHLLDVLAGIDGTEASKNVQGILTEFHPVVGKAVGTGVILMPPQHPVFTRHANGLGHAGQGFHLLQIQGLGVANQIDFTEQLFGTLHPMHAVFDTI